MTEKLYPLTFEPIFKAVMWGGTALRPFLGALPSSEPTGEAWLLSDEGESLSRVANGPLAGTTLRLLIERCQHELLGDLALTNGRFPLLLKFLDARENLSVQVHPDDDQARLLEPAGTGLGKTEAWLILKAEPGARVYAGLRDGIGRREFDAALRQNKLPDVLHSYEPRVGDCIFIEAGTVHAIGAGLMLFEIQQTSDITYRLYDWGRIDARTGQPRQLHIEQALACTRYERGPCNPVRPVRNASGDRDRLIQCRYFTLDHALRSKRGQVEATGKCRQFVVLAGSGRLLYNRDEYEIKAGQVYLLPASMGVCELIPDSELRILECSAGS